MARCCDVCGKPIGSQGYIVNICYWDGSFSSHEQCCISVVESMNRVKAYAVPFETPDPMAVREMSSNFTYFQEEDE
jgi:hypothetical protein